MLDPTIDPVPHWYTAPVPIVPPPAVITVLTLPQTVTGAEIVVGAVDAVRTSTVKLTPDVNVPHVGFVILTQYVVVPVGFTASVLVV